MKTRSLSYKAVFFMAGVAFALATTYIVAALVYQAESYRATLDAAPGADFLATATSLLSVHVLAFLPWVLGTIGIFIALGYSFDTQIRLRRKAELLQARAEALAVTDGLTLLYNRTYFIDQLDLEIRRTKRRSYTFSLLFVDIDEFKKYRCGELPGGWGCRRRLDQGRGCRHVRGQRLREEPGLHRTGWAGRLRSSEWPQRGLNPNGGSVGDAGGT